MTAGKTMTANQGSGYALAGDVVNVGILVASIVYLYIVICYTLPGAVGVVDDYWKRDGFCIANMNVPYWSSFDTCLYVDVTFSAIIGLLYFHWKDLPGMKVASALVPAVIASTLGHGMAHGAQAVQLRNGTYHQDEVLYHYDDAPLWKIIAGVVLFWFPLLKGALNKMSNFHVGILAIAVTYTGLFVRIELGFPYVQTVINLAFHASQLMLPKEEKSLRTYMTTPMSNILPLAVAYTEFLFCDSFFRSIGGHVLYDSSIVISFIIYYCDAYRYSTNQGLTKKKVA